MAPDDLLTTAARALAIASSAASRCARGAHAGLVVLGIEARVHPRLVVGGSDQTGERRAGLLFKVCGKAVIAPRFAHRRLRAGLVALREQGARERKAALGAVRPLAGEEAR